MLNAHLNSYVIMSVIRIHLEVFLFPNLKKNHSMIRNFHSYKAILTFLKHFAKFNYTCHLYAYIILEGKRKKNFLKKSSRTLISVLNPMFQRQLFFSPLRMI